MAKTNISEIVGSLLSGVQGIAKSETIVGAPQQAGDATVIPVHRVKIAFGAASASAGAHGKTAGGDSGGHAAGGAVEMEPVAAIAVGKDGSAHLLPVDGEAQTAWSALLQEMPDLLTRVAQSLGERAKTLLAAEPTAEPSRVAERQLADRDG